MLAVAVVIVTMVAWRVILKVPQQRAKVEQCAAGLEACVYGLEVTDQVGRRVEEEYGRDRVVGARVLRVRVQAQKVGRAHGHLARGGLDRGHGGGGVDVGDGVALQVVLAGRVIGEDVNPGVDGVLLGGLHEVEDV